ncbi:hypothetical protein D3C72_2320060 [compost metagenome]
MPTAKQGVWLFAPFFGPDPILHGNIVRGQLRLLADFGEGDQGRMVVLRDQKIVA